MANPKTCFFISPIGLDKSEDRKRSDQVFKFIIGPVCDGCGYQVTRADKIQAPGIITSQVVQQVLDSNLVIADLTGWNPNVFYELAIRHAFRRPYVQMIESNQRIPFDVAGVRTIQWDHHDLDSVEQCKVDLDASIRAIERDPDSIESPVSVAVDIQDMRKSGKPIEQSVADIRQSLEGMQQKLDEIAANTVQQSQLTYQSNAFGLYSHRPTTFTIKSPNAYIADVHPATEFTAFATPSVQGAAASAREVPRVENPGDEGNEKE